MPKNIRPWLRFIEGAGGNNGGGQGGQGGSGDAGAQGGSGDAGKNTDGDQGSGDRGSGEGGKSGGGGKSGDDPAPKQKSDPDPAPKQKDKTSEPAPKDGGKADDSSEVAKLKSELAELKESLGQITQDREKEAREKRDNLATDVAKRFGLPVSSAHRLQGDTKDELEADAKALAKDLGYKLEDPTQGQGAGGTKTPKSLDDAVAANIAAAGLK